MGGSAGVVRGYNRNVFVDYLTGGVLCNQQIKKQPQQPFNKPQQNQPGLNRPQNQPGMKRPQGGQQGGINKQNPGHSSWSNHGGTDKRRDK